MFTLREHYYIMNKKACWENATQSKVTAGPIGASPLYQNKLDKAELAETLLSA